MPTNQPFAVTSPDEEGLQYLAVEVSYGGLWVNINDHERFVINADQTRDNTSKQWRKITAESPVLEGNYLVHAVPDMVSEQISVFVHGTNQTDLADNFFFLDELFSQPEFTVRWTTNEYREYWRCQLADSSSSRAQVWTHSQMAVSTFTVPRFPTVTRERIG